MEPTGDADLFLNAIKKEINTILNESAANPNLKLKYSSSKKSINSATSSNLKLNCTSSKKSINSSPTPSLKSSSSKNSIYEEQVAGCSSGTSINSSRNSRVSLSGLGSKTSQRAKFLEHQASHDIEDNLQRMQLELQQSYEHFQTMSNKFENIDFSGLKKRIKNLNLGVKTSTTSMPNTDELKKIFEKKYNDNHLENLTSEMGDKFGQHPGEFGDIPELSTFFQTCSQLERGIEHLRRQQDDVSDLKNRMCCASEVAYDRIAEIRKEMAKKS